MNRVQYNVQYYGPNMTVEIGPVQGYIVEHDGLLYGISHEHYVTGQLKKDKGIYITEIYTGLLMNRAANNTFKLAEEEIHNIAYNPEIILNVIKDNIKRLDMDGSVNPHLIGGNQNYGRL